MGREGISPASYLFNLFASVYRRLVRCFIELVVEVSMLFLSRIVTIFMGWSEIHDHVSIRYVVIEGTSTSRSSHNFMPVCQVAHSLMCEGGAHGCVRMSTCVWAGEYAHLLI